jgi:hypothetical protein
MRKNIDGRQVRNVTAMHMRQRSSKFEHRCDRRSNEVDHINENINEWEGESEDDDG